MPRRREVPKRKILSDPKFNDQLVTRFVNMLMWDGKKSTAFKIFYDIREVPGIKKKPSTSELIDWLKLLMTDDVDAKILREKDPKKLIPPLHGALLKNEQDVQLFERLAFLDRKRNA